jgi:hypothetical protein
MQGKTTCEAQKGRRSEAVRALVVNIRKRWIGSHENLIRLIPFVRTLRVFDNSREVAAGEEPAPELLLSIEAGELAYPAPKNLSATPEWVKPIVAAAYRHFGLMP